MKKKKRHKIIAIPQSKITTYVRCCNGKKSDAGIDAWRWTETECELCLKSKNLKMDAILSRFK